MAFWLKCGPRRRQVDTSWPAAYLPSPRHDYPSDGALRDRVRYGRLHRWHRCTCGCIGPRTCALCNRALCMYCAVRPRAVPGTKRKRVHPRCLVARDGYIAVLRLLYRHRIASALVAQHA